MSDPASQDDGWDELARELGVDKSAPRADAHTPDPELPRGRDAEPVLDLDDDVYAADAESVAEDVGSDDDVPDDAGAAEGDEPAGEGQPGEEQPGTGRKRRRRRRRRKKGGAAAGAEASENGAPAAGDEGDEADETPAPPRRQPVAARAPRVEEAADAGDDFDAEADEEPGSSMLAAEEDAGGELLRDLTANWNVPSWDEIISGLYRPER